MKNRKTIFRNLIIIFVLVASLFFRLYKISWTPPGLTMDEASIGYNAYSILISGRDEYGKSFPLIFRSFADYKLPVYFYLTVPFIKLFGLNVLSLRFVSILLGTFSGLLIYLIARELFGEQRGILALLALLVFLFSPWSILYSRGAFEANAALFFLLLGILFQLIAFKKNQSRYLYLGAVAYAFSTYAYHSERVLAFLLLPLLSLFFLDFKIKRETLVLKLIPPFLLFILIALPQYRFLGQAAGNTRLKSTGIIKEEELKAVKQNPFQAIPLFERQLSLYFAYFSPRSLFFEPDPMTTRSLPELSTYYSWMVVPFFYGLYLLGFKEDFKKRRILIMLLLVTPVAASFTGDPFASLRALPLIVPISIIIALGLERIFLYRRPISSFLICLLFPLSLLSLWRSLFYLLPYEKYLEWNCGFSQVVEKLEEFPREKVLFDDPIGDRYPELLFFTKYPPKIFQQEQNPINLNNYYSISKWTNTVKFGRISVRAIIWEKDSYTRQLIIATPLAISVDQAKEHFLTLAFAIMAPDGKVIYNGYLTNPQLKKEDDARKLKLQLKE